MSSENKKSLSIAKTNLLLMAAAFVIIVIGFILMSGEGTTQEFNEEVFSPMKITVGPMVSLFGFIFMIVAILWKKPNADKE